MGDNFYAAVLNVGDCRTIYFDARVWRMEPICGRFHKSKNIEENFSRIRYLSVDPVQVKEQDVERNQHDTNQNFREKPAIDYLME